MCENEELTRGAAMRATMDSVFCYERIEDTRQPKDPKPVRFEELWPEQKKDALERLLQQAFDLGVKALTRRFPELAEVLNSVRGQVDDRILGVREDAFIQDALGEMDDLVISDDLAWLID